MPVEEKALEVMLKNGMFDEEDQKVGGIAKLAVDKGYQALSPAQQRVLEPFLSVRCSGVEDPGGYHNDCVHDIQGEELPGALEHSAYYGATLCESCREETDRYANEWARIQAE